MPSAGDSKAGERTANVEDGDVAEEGGELVGVHRRGGHDELEVPGGGGGERTRKIVAFLGAF